MNMTETTTATGPLDTDMHSPKRSHLAATVSLSESLLINMTGHTKLNRLARCCVHETLSKLMMLVDCVSAMSLSSVLR